jgi:hypothetical protein
VIRRPNWTTVGMAGAVVVAVVGAGFLLQRVALKEPPHASDAALRAAAWLERYRLVDSTFSIGGGPTVHGQCLQDWIVTGGDRRRGAVLRLDDGVTVLAVPPHTLTVSGGTAAERAVSPLVLLELGGCPRVLARRVQTLAQQRSGLALQHGSLVFDLKATHVTMALDPRSGIPTGLRIGTRSISGTSQIRFARVTTRIRSQLLPH